MKKEHCYCVPSWTDRHSSPPRMRASLRSGEGDRDGLPTSVASHTMRANETAKRPGARISCRGSRTNRTSHERSFTYLFRQANTGRRRRTPADVVAHGIGYRYRSFSTAQARVGTAGWGTRVSWKQPSCLVSGSAPQRNATQRISPTLVFHDEILLATALHCYCCYCYYHVFDCRQILFDASSSPAHPDMCREHGRVGVVTVVGIRDPAVAVERRNDE